MTTIQDFVDAFGEEHVLRELKRSLAVPEHPLIDPTDQHCGDPRCVEHGEFATHYRNSMVCDTSRWQGTYAPSIEFTTVERSLSCTGPIELVIEFKRDLLQNLEIGDESVHIILTEPVV